MTVCVKQTMILIGCSDCQGEGIMAHNVLQLYGMNVLGGIYIHDCTCDSHR